jgi:hypothetical protein
MSYVSEFIKNKDENRELYETYISLGIRRPNQDSIEEVFKTGEFQMYQGSDDEAFPSETGVWFLYKNSGLRKINNIVHSIEFDSTFNKINITDLTLMDITDDRGINPDYLGSIYNLKGSFQTLLKTENGEIVELIIDEFSLVFLDF